MEKRKKFVLWRTKWDLEACVDNFGISHSGYVVLEQIPVTVTEIRNNVPGEWGGKKKFQGWKATSDKGETFTCNWHNFPDDSLQPTFHWDARTDVRGTWQPVDGIQAYNGKYSIYATPDGQRAIPLGAVICKKHDYAYLDDDNLGCWKCDLEKTKREK